MSTPVENGLLPLTVALQKLLDEAGIGSKRPILRVLLTLRHLAPPAKTRNSGYVSAEAYFRGRVNFYVPFKYVVNECAHSFRQKLMLSLKQGERATG